MKLGAIDKSRWRYPNLDPRDCSATAQAVEYLRTPQSLTQPEFRCRIEGCHIDFKYYLANFVYAYGFPLPMVYKSVLFYIDSMMRDLNTRFQTMHPNAKFGNNCFLLYCFARLVAEDQAAKVLLDLNQKLNQAEFAETNHRTDTNLYAETAIIEDRVDEKAIRCARFSAAEMGQDHLAPLAERDSDEFNRYLEDLAIRCYGRIETRHRKRKVRCDWALNLAVTAEMALALERGMRITYCDPALPIWDFPIAQRPDVQKLLAPEIVAQIPRNLAGERHGN